jgi:hypothetical protein
VWLGLGGCFNTCPARFGLLGERFGEDGYREYHSSPRVARILLRTVITFDDSCKPMKKRTLQINSRLSPEDLALLKKAAEKLWPGMPISNSTLLLTLARLKAEEILKKK